VVCWFATSNSCDFYLLGMPQDKVCSNNLRSIDKMKESIQHVVHLEGDRFNSRLKEFLY